MDFPMQLRRLSMIMTLWAGKIFAFHVESPYNGSMVRHGKTSNYRTIKLHDNDVDEDNSSFDPLDVMLAKARKRGVNPMFRIQAFAGTPVLNKGIVLTRADVFFTVAAVLIGAKGFAFGLLVGKWTLNRLPFRRDMPPILMQLYPVLLAIACDLSLF